MSTTLEEQLKTVKEEAKKTIEESTVQRVVARTQSLDKLGRAYGTGRRKESVARVWIKPGRGQVLVNGRPVLEYFSRSVLRTVVMQPFAVTDRKDRYDVFCAVKGGGLSGQAGAVRHGIARALADFEPHLRAALKPAGLLSRDPREVERKKFGLMKARRSFQFSKR